MKINEKGVLKESEIFFHNATNLSKKIFFNITCCGNYACDLHYKVQRNTYHSYLLLYVIKGYGYLNQDNKITTLKENSISLINCNIPHEYGTHSGWKIYWAHFNGELAHQWYNLIIKKNKGYKELDNSINCYKFMKELIDNHKYNNGANEALTNKLLVNILSELLIEENINQTQAPFETIVGYINNNLNKKISIDELANRACMSKFHFIRTFKKEFGYSPHEFIINSRINAAKFYLLSSDKSLKEIVYLCGFNTESAFSNSFKKEVHLSPAKYRQKNKNKGLLNSKQS